MAKIEYGFDDFLTSVEDSSKNFVNEVHHLLLDADYTHKVEYKASGFFVAYTHPNTKRSLLNFLFRKTGLYIRIYSDNCPSYANVLENLPNEMLTQIDKASVCKRLIDPTACNSRCLMGYDFQIGNQHYQKCRSNCFYFNVGEKTIPHLLKIVEGEVTHRTGENQ